MFSTLPAHAIQPQRWVHSTEADFEAGEMDGVVATNLGDLKLATGVETLGELPEGVSVIYDLAVVGDTTFIAAGPEGKLLKLVEGEITEVADLPDHQVFALLPSTEGFVTAALSGKESKLVAYDAEGQVVREMVLPEDVRYVWDMATRNDGKDLVLATGPDGKLLGVNSEGEVTELLDTAQANILCLAQDPDGRVYAGTDTDGLVYRLEADGSSYVVYDAAEPEIGAILVAEDGKVYFGTADAEQARPGRMAEAAAAETGRPAPEGDGSALDVIPIEPPAEVPGDPEPTPMQDAPAENRPAAAAPDEPASAPEAASDAMPEAAAEMEAPPEVEAPESEDPGDVATPAETAGPPAPAQYDALREEVRKRLLAARKSGAMAAAPGSARPTRNGKPAATSGGAAGGGEKVGNAVYRLDDQGFVAEVFRESVMVLKLVELPDGRLLIGTGSEGQLYRLDPAAGETTVLNDLEPEQLLAIALGNNATIVVGGANPAAILSLTDSPAESGTYTSAALDATHISLWGVFQVTAAFSAPSASMTVETRSGNVADPDIAAWSQWSEAQTITPDADADSLQPFEVKVASPPARFIQYRLTLFPGNRPHSSNVSVGRVELAYVTPNLRPSIASLTAAYPDFAGVDQPVSPAMSINWEATDDNADRLLFAVEYQPARGTASSTWLTLGEDLAEPSLDWDTRKVPDGRYRLRITASDRLDNPGGMAMTARRLADPVLIDNTPPQVKDLTVDVAGRTATISGTAVDEFSPIQSIAYSLDDAERPEPVLPDDLIYDSTSEAWSATLLDLSPGGHAITVRILDARGNATYTSELFEIK